MDGYDGAVCFLCCAQGQLPTERFYFALYATLACGHEAAVATCLATFLGHVDHPLPEQRLVSAASASDVCDPDPRLCQPFAPLDPDLLFWLPETPVPVYLQLTSQGCSSTMPTPQKHPATIASALGLGRLVALRKPAGGVPPQFGCPHTCPTVQLTPTRPHMLHASRRGAIPSRI